MSWHFSQVMEEAFWADIFLGGELSALWKSMPFAPDDSCSAKMKATCHRSPFGMMYVPSTDSLGEAMLTLFREDFLVRTSPPLGIVLDSRATDRPYGFKWNGLLVKYDRNLCCWKTHRFSESGVLPTYLLDLPKWGMIHDGALLERTTLACPMSGTDFCLYPTPTASIWKGWTFNEHHRSTYTRIKRLYGLELTNGAPPGPELLESMLGWPIGWSAPEPLEMASFQKWLDWHGPLYEQAKLASKDRSNGRGVP